MDIQILAQQFYDYSVVIKGYSPATIRRYKHVIGGFCKFTGVNNLQEVTNEKVRGLFFFGRTQRKWSPHTFLVYYLTLKVFFRWCIKQGYITQNPVADIEVPKTGKQLPKNINKQDALRILDIAYNLPYQDKFLRFRNHAIFAIFIFAGLRKQELLQLKFADVDVENLTLFVQHGKGDKDRMIPISFSLAQILKRYIDERKRLQFTCPQFFASSNRNTGFSDSGLKRLIKTLNNSSGIKFTAHSLRHTFATLMLDGGCDIYNLSRMMGHSNIQTTTIYLSASISQLRSQMVKHPMNNLVNYGFQIQP